MLRENNWMPKFEAWSRIQKRLVTTWIFPNICFDFRYTGETQLTTEKCMEKLKLCGAHALSVAGIVATGYDLARMWATSTNLLHNRHTFNCLNALNDMAGSQIFVLTSIKEQTLSFFSVLNWVYRRKFWQVPSRKLECVT